MLNREFYAALRAGAPRRRLRRLARRLLRAAGDEDEARRWRRWTDVLSRRGARVKVSTWPTEVLLDSEITDAERLRAAETPADLLEEDAR